MAGKHLSRLVVAVVMLAAAPGVAQQPQSQPPSPSADAPPWMQGIAESVDCLRGVDANPLFAAVRVHMPNAEAMRLAHIDDRGKPTPREQEILVRYAEAAATCIPQLAGPPTAESPAEPQPDAQGAAVAALLERLWGEQTALLRRLAEGNLTWGRYNREAMQLDRNLRRELAAIRKKR